MDFDPKLCPCIDCATRPDERKEKLTYDWVNPTLAVGAAIPPAGYADLAAQGVTHIMSAFETIDDGKFASGMQVLWIPQLDDGTPRRLEALEEAIQFVKSAGSEAKIYAHCHAGSNRGPTLAYLVLRVRGMSSGEAIDAIRKARPKAGFYRIETYLDSVERALKEVK